jgi:hypothetical protein
MRVKRACAEWVRKVVRRVGRRFGWRVLVAWKEVVREGREL